jgi:hypothetical protein
MRDGHGSRQHFPFKGETFGIEVSRIASGDRCNENSRNEQPTSQRVRTHERTPKSCVHVVREVSLENKCFQHAYVELKDFLVESLLMREQRDRLNGLRRHCV